MNKRNIAQIYPEHFSLLFIPFTRSLPENYAWRIIVIIYSVFFIASIFFLNFFFFLRSCIACMRTHRAREKEEKKINDETEWKKSWRNKDKKKQRKHKMDFSWNWKIDSPSEVLMVLRRKKFMVYVYGISLHLVLNTNYGLRHEIKSSI